MRNRARGTIPRRYGRRVAGTGRRTGLPDGANGRGAGASRRTLTLRIEVDGSVLAPEISPAEFEKAARSEFRGLDRLELDAAAVPERGRRRLLDRHQHVARGLATMLQLGDRHAAEQAELRKAPLAFVDLREPERLARRSTTSRRIVFSLMRRLPVTRMWSDDDPGALVDREPDVRPVRSSLRAPRRNRRAPSGSRR